MASNSTDSQNPPKLKNLIGQNYESVLNQSIQELLQLQTSDISSSLSTFYQLILPRENPPLETIWVYSALTFSNRDLPNDKILDRISAIKDLLQLLAGCSASCSSSKSIALLAPVIYEVHEVIVHVKGKGEELGCKREKKKVMREIKALVNSLLGFISVCCSGNDDECDSALVLDELIRPLEELIRIWIENGSGGKLEKKELFELFLPILGGADILGWLKGDIGVNELAGVVVTEAFFLRLCLDLCSGVSEKELRSWAVGSITGMRNFNFFETLVKLLLEKHLPVNSLLSSEDEVSLRTVLYDAVLLVEYSFLNLDEVIHQSAKRVITLAIARVLVSHEATELFRKKGNHLKALSYINAFSSSQLPSQLVKLVRNEVGMEIKADRPKAMSPQAILKWLLNLEHQGIRLLDDSISNLLNLVMSETENETSEYNRGGKILDADLPFYIDNKGELEDENEDDERAEESKSAAFVAAARTMASTENRRERKRKEGRMVGKKRRVKFQKHELYDESGEKSSILGNDALTSESEVENATSDDDTKGK